MTQDTLIDALVMATELREWDPNEILGLLPFVERIFARHRLRSYLHRWKKAK